MLVKTPKSDFNPGGGLQSQNSPTNPAGGEAAPVFSMGKRRRDVPDVNTEPF
jgi:hypothetical protein